jgi:hypothetical protein
MSAENPFPTYPIRRGPVRFAVGHPNGLTSNAWIVWTGKPGDIYMACRDNFKEAKVSLHASGRWRMAWTEKAVEKNSKLLWDGGRRTWDVWDKPPPSLPGVVTAFHLVFPTSELAVRPEQRPPNDWSRVVYIEAAPPGQMILVTLFVTNGDPILEPPGGPSVRLASIGIGDGRSAQLMAYGAPERDMPAVIERCTSEARTKARSAQIEVGPETYGYFLGRLADGARYIVGARVLRT